MRPSDRFLRFGLGAGFMISWVYIYLGMAALGLSIEAMITILTPRFAPFFLFLLVGLLSAMDWRILTLF